MSFYTQVGKDWHKDPEPPLIYQPFFVSECFFEFSARSVFLTSDVFNEFSR